MISKEEEVERERERKGLMKKSLFFYEVKRKSFYLLTAFQTILPSIIGTTWVKLKPESTTIVHSAAGRFG